MKIEVPPGMTFNTVEDLEKAGSSAPTNDSGRPWPHFKHTSPDYSWEESWVSGSRGQSLFKSLRHMIAQKLAEGTPELLDRMR